MTDHYKYSMIPYVGKPLAPSGIKPRWLLLNAPIKVDASAASFVCGGPWRGSESFSCRICHQITSRLDEYSRGPGDGEYCRDCCIPPVPPTESKGALADSIVLDGVLVGSNELEHCRIVGVDYGIEPSVDRMNCWQCATVFEVRGTSRLCEPCVLYEQRLDDLASGAAVKILAGLASEKPRPNVTRQQLRQNAVTHPSTWPSVGDDEP